MFNKFPWTNLYNLNLDWILEKFKHFENVLGRIEETGFVRTVNNQTGDVNLSARDVGAIPANETNVQLNNVEGDNWSLWRNASGTATGIKFDKTTPYAEIVNGSSRYKVYNEGNPPPYPVTKVNNKTGAVTLSATDVNARPNNWTPSADDINARLINAVFAADAGTTINQLDLSDLFSRGYRFVLTKRTQDTNFTGIYGLDRAENGEVTANAYDPAELSGAVTSVNRKTGNVILTAKELSGVIRVKVNIATTGVITDSGESGYNRLSEVTSDMALADIVITPRNAQLAEWTLTTSNGGMSVTGTISQSCTAICVLCTLK